MLQKHLKSLLGSRDAWATPPEILIWSISIGDRKQHCQLVSARVVLKQVFTHFQKHACSNITSSPSKFSLDTLLASQFSFSPMYGYLPAALKITLPGELAPRRRQNAYLCFQRINSRDVPTYFSILFSILEVNQDNQTGYLQHVIMKKCERVDFRWSFIWIGYLTFLNLSFLICKMGTMAPTF